MINRIVFRVVTQLEGESRTLFAQDAINCVTQLVLATISLPKNNPKSTKSAMTYSGFAQIAKKRCNEFMKKPSNEAVDKRVKVALVEKNTEIQRLSEELKLYREENVVLRKNQTELERTLLLQNQEIEKLNDSFATPRGKDDLDTLVNAKDEEIKQLKSNLCQKSSKWLMQ